MSQPSPDPSLALKTAPPKVRRAGLPAGWLARLGARLGEHAVALVQAPGGFGKSTLLAQWRLDFLAAGALVGWLTIDERDGGVRFVSALAASLATATGNSGFDLAARHVAEISGGELDALTELLAKVIEIARPIVLVIDEAQEIPESTAREFLSYLFYNLPANLRIIVGTRQSLQVATAELLARGELVSIGPQDLRLRVEETIEFLRERFGERFDVDECARVHEVTAGWPMAVQLAASVFQSDPARRVSALTGNTRDIEHFFAETVLERLPPREGDFAVACSILDAIHPDLCRAMTEEEDAGELLDAVQRATPILSPAEGTDWWRMHPLARTAFARQLAAFPAAQRNKLHWGAAGWLHRHGHTEGAARHALASGHAEIAYQWIGEALYRHVSTGHLAEVLEWAERLPPAVLDLPMVRLAVAWAQAMSYRPGPALDSAAKLQSSTIPELRFHGALIQASIAIYADDVDAAEKCLEPWAVEAPIKELRSRQIYANVRAYLLLQDGELERARYEQAAARQSEAEDLADLPTSHGAWVVGITYLLEGRPRLAEKALRPTIERAEAVAGRRSVVACTIATALAAACWDQDRRSETETILAYRIDVIERTGPPESVVLVYLLLARAAWAAGQEARAVDLLQRMQMLGEHRHQPRLLIYAIAEQLRLHAGARRADTCGQLAERLETCWRAARPSASSNRSARLDLLRDVGWARALIAAGDFEPARIRLANARSVARKLGRTRDVLEARVLLAMISDPEHSETAAALRESLSIAEANGYLRLFADAHPGVIPVVREFARRKGPQDSGASPAFIERIAGEAAGERMASAPRQRVAAPALLTAKEASILEFLSRGLSNKEIARAIDVGQETVKWHLKNLFGKLGAGSRRHAVDRARTLGLI